MLRVTLAQAEPGMELAMPVYHPHRTSVVLLRAGARLDEHTLKRLREMPVGELWIQFPPLDHLRRMISPELLVSCGEMTRRVAATIDQLAEKPHAHLDYYTVRQAVVLVIEALAGSPLSGQFMTDLAMSRAPAVRHACNVCLTSVLMGLKLDFHLVHERARLGGAQAKDVTPLGVGAMLHDIGMTQLDTATLARWDEHADERDEAWRRHVQVGFEMVQGDFDPASAGVVLHHHQGFDGSGFPSRTEFSGEVHTPEGSEIHVFARICAAADMLDRLRFPEYGMGPAAHVSPRMSKVGALARMLRSSLRDRFDPYVLMALVNVSPPFSPGMVVMVESRGKKERRRGVVTNWSVESPCRPSVAILGGADGSSWWDDEKAEVVELSKTPELSIVEAEGFDVRGDLFEPIEAGEFDIVRAARQMMNAAPEITPSDETAVDKPSGEKPGDSREAA
ncbi:MAG: HD-GYP domain-containing protein [Phycisphaerales bacterium]